MAKNDPNVAINSEIEKFIDEQANNVKNVPSKKKRSVQFKKRFRIAKDLSEKYLINETFKAFIKMKKEYTSESVLECPKCKGNKVSCISRQISRADESEDFFAKCLNEKCKHAWRFK